MPEDRRRLAPGRLPDSHHIGDLGLMPSTDEAAPGDASQFRRPPRRGRRPSSDGLAPAGRTDRATRLPQRLHLRAAPLPRSRRTGSSAAILPATSDARGLLLAEREGPCWSTRASTPWRTGRSAHAAQSLARKLDEQISPGRSGRPRCRISARSCCCATTKTSAAAMPAILQGAGITARLAGQPLSQSHRQLQRPGRPREAAAHLAERQLTTGCREVIVEVNAQPVMRFDMRAALPGLGAAERQGG